ncbi:ATP-dependent DNA helicase PIF1 [Prunus yedoensis var. nudiflora]|uniref:ATP-dependent DNA helicase PIF1 n=1 Tax=Prunus yedoensis var. nudiflora TaxID=2094558 RepID=A0A314Z9F4_PRUYE|nr:ATP-dependent DNA helicase PIF1 [Prunus yedoensis var. nudiflora]
MVYVALSRVRSLEGLYLSGFDPSKIKVHPKVVQFHNKFISEQDKEGEDDNVSQNKNGSNDNSSQEIDGQKYVRAYFK